MNFSRLRNLVTLSVFFTTSGCGLLLGNVKPVEQKSDDYSVEDLSATKPDWKKMESGPTDSTEIPDLSFQSAQSASIISLNSTCRKPEGPEQTLKEATRVLLLGISDVTLREEQNTQIEGVPALQTTVLGKLNQQPMKIRTVVIHKRPCVYDLMYLASPEHFDSKVQDFSQFVSSLRLK